MQTFYYELNKKFTNTKQYGDDKMAYYIYKHLDSNGNVIYCGQTKNIKKRQSEHLLNAKWKDEITKIEYAEVSDRMLMDLYEKYYISFHAPKYNIKDISCDYIRFLKI